MVEEGRYPADVPLHASLAWRVGGGALGKGGSGAGPAARGGGGPRCGAQQGVRLGNSTRNLTLLALTLHNRAEAWLGLGELRRARIDADEAVVLWQRIGSPLAAFGLALTARVHRVRGATRQAVAAYQAALAMPRTGAPSDCLPSTRRPSRRPTPRP